MIRASLGLTSTLRRSEKIPVISHILTREALLLSHMRHENGDMCQFYWMEVRLTTVYGVLVGSNEVRGYLVNERL
jgi:hypothetical protein